MSASWTEILPTEFNARHYGKFSVIKLDYRKLTYDRRGGAV